MYHWKICCVDYPNDHDYILDHEKVKITYKIRLKICVRPFLFICMIILSFYLMSGGKYLLPLTTWQCQAIL